MPLKDQVAQLSLQAIVWDLATWQSTARKRVLLFLRLQKIQKSKFTTSRHSGQIRKLLLSRKKTNYHYEDAMLLASFFYIRYFFNASVTRCAVGRLTSIFSSALVASAKV